MSSFPDVRLGVLAAGDLNAVRWVDLPSHVDDRGALTVAEGNRDIPFEIKRIYFVHDVRAERGGHAHRDTHQVVIAVSGRCEITLSDGQHENSYVLDDLRRGLYLGPMLYVRTGGFTAGTVLVSLASTHYDTARSIRSWPEFLAALGR